MAIDSIVFLKHPVLQVTASIADILSDLNIIATLNQQIAQKRAKLITLAIVAFIGIPVVCLGFIIVNAIVTSIPIIVPILLVVGLIGLGVYAIFAVINQNQLDIVAYRYLLLQQLLETLSRDTADNANVSLHAEFGKPFLNQKRQTTIPHPVHQNYKIDFFCDRWLDLQGEFLDGNQFHVLATEFQQKTYGWKRGRSGKSKYKEKFKSKGAEVALTLTYSQRKYGAIQVLHQEIENAIQLPEGTMLKRIKVTPKSIHLAVKVPPLVLETSESVTHKQLYQTMTTMFLSLYQVLNLAKKLSRQTGT